MDIQRIEITHPEENESPIQSRAKIYHSPQLIEWGNLQELTRSGSGLDLDSLNSTASNVFGKPIPVDPNNPWHIPPIRP